MNLASRCYTGTAPERDLDLNLNAGHHRSRGPNFKPVDVRHDLPKERHLGGLLGVVARAVRVQLGK